MDAKPRAARAINSAKLAPMPEFGIRTGSLEWRNPDCLPVTVPARYYPTSAAPGLDRAIEIVDRVRMAKHLYPTMLAMQQVQEINARDMENLIAAFAEGYPFPAISMSIHP